MKAVYSTPVSAVGVRDGTIGSDDGTLGRNRRVVSGSCLRAGAHTSNLLAYIPRLGV